MTATVMTTAPPAPASLLGDSGNSDDSGDSAVRFNFAPQYRDLWAELFDDFGHLIGGFMCFYVRMAGESEHPCGTLMASKVWDCLRTDPLQYVQR